MKKTIALVWLFVFLGQTNRAEALTIIIDYLGGTPPTNSIGSGNLLTIFTCACKVWELAIKDDFTIIIHVGWAPVGGGQHQMDAEGGTPSRELEATILFNDDNQPGHYAFYLDPNPLAGTNALMTYTEEASNLGAGPINSTRWYQWPTLGNQLDLYTICLHEIGHSLGLSFGNDDFMDSVEEESVSPFVDISGMPYAGTAVPLQMNDYGVVSHIAYVSDRPLMAGSIAPGDRVVPSALDILTDGFLSQFTNLNLCLAPELSISGLTTKNGSTAMVMSWIQPIGKYAVEQSSDVGQAIWMPVTNAITELNGTYSVTVPVNHQGVVFFRLKRTQ